MKDYYLVTLIGFLVGALALLPIANSGFLLSTSIVFGSILGATVLAPIAFWITRLIARRIPVFERFGKFAAIGTLNTLIDLGVLNILIFLTNEPQGTPFKIFKTISFCVATTNSYFWNKFWTFQSKLPVTAKEYMRFAAFTLVGTLINVSVASFVVGIFAPSSPNPKLWANIGALVAVIASFLWNFLSYNNFVFKSRPSEKI